MVFALGQLDCKLSEKNLLSQLRKEKSRSVIEQLIPALGQTGDEETLREVWKYPDIDNHITTFLKSLVHFFDNEVMTSDFIELCTVYLKSANLQNRRNASYALARIKSAEHLQPYLEDLQKAAKCNDAAVRARILKILKILDFENKATLFGEALSDEDANVRVEAICGLTSVPDAVSLWRIALDSEDIKTLTAVLENIPPDIDFQAADLEKLYALLDHSSNHIKGLTIEYITEKFGPDTLKQKIGDILPISLLPYKVEGLRKNGRGSVLQELRKLSNHRNLAVSTSAYYGLHSLTMKYFREDNFPLDSLKEVIRYGLESRDGVRIAIAATAISDSTEIFSSLLPIIYETMKGLNTPQYTDAVLQILETLKIYGAVDAYESIWPFLRSREYIVRKKARETLEFLYDVDDITLPDVGFISRKTINLSKLSQHGLNPKVQIRTNKGVFVIECDGFFAPFTVSQFLKLVDMGFYNGLSFHRVVADFVIQGGDPRGDGWGGPDFTLLTERSPITYNTGSVGMASSGPNTEGSQFFVTLSDQPHLDYKYTRFGNIIDGLDIVNNIEKGDKILIARVVSEK